MRGLRMDGMGQPAPLAHRQVRVGSPQPDRLLALLQRFGFTVRRVDAHELVVERSSADEVGSVARFFHVPLHDLSER